MAYFGLASGQVYAITATPLPTEAGQVIWTFNAGAAVLATPLITADTVYITSLDHHLYALDRATGRQRWKTDLGAAIAGTPALVNSMLYVGAFDKKLHALHADTGAEQWAFEATNWIWSGPTVFADQLYFTDISGVVFALDLEGRELWRAQPGGVMRAAPTVTDDTVYVGDRDGKFFALQRSNGTARWPQPIALTGQVLVAPALYNDILILAPFQGDNLLVGYTTAGAPTTLAWKPSQ
jgi:outer membrane protein assembly factor BamB